MYYILEPRVSTKFPKDYLEKVKEVHSKGGYGSLGYRYDWKLEEAQKNLLRTHTTAVSARVLHKLMEEVCNLRRNLKVLPLKIMRYKEKSFAGRI